MTAKERREKEKRELKELWDKVTFTVEPRKTKVIEADKKITYKANKLNKEEEKWLKKWFYGTEYS